MTSLEKDLKKQKELRIQRLRAHIKAMKSHIAFAERSLDADVIPILPISDLGQEVRAADWVMCEAQMIARIAIDVE